MSGSKFFLGVAGRGEGFIVRSRPGFRTYIGVNRFVAIHIAESTEKTIQIKGRACKRLIEAMKDNPRYIVKS